MSAERNQFQIIRKDARNCFVESLSDMFHMGRIHLGFATYDLEKPTGSRQTNNVHIYITVGEFLELCRKLIGGELRAMVAKSREKKSSEPLFQCMGGTSAEKLKRLGKPRKDGKSLSRVAKLLAGQKSTFLFVADSGPGETDAKGLIVPRFGNKPENHVAVSMTFESLSELLLVTLAHYQAWLSASYRVRDEETNFDTVPPEPSSEDKPLF